MQAILHHHPLKALSRHTGIHSTLTRKELQLALPHLIKVKMCSPSVDLTVLMSFLYQTRLWLYEVVGRVVGRIPLYIEPLMIFPMWTTGCICQMNCLSFMLIHNIHYYFSKMDNRFRSFSAFLLVESSLCK